MGLNWPPKSPIPIPAFPLKGKEIGIFGPHAIALADCARLGLPGKKRFRMMVRSKFMQYRVVPG
jgi:hypothetical protein